MAYKTFKAFKSFGIDVLELLTEYSLLENHPSNGANSSLNTPKAIHPIRLRPESRIGSML